MTVFIRRILPLASFACLLLTSCTPEQTPSTTLPAPQATAPTMVAAASKPAAPPAPVQPVARQEPLAAPQTVEQLIARAEAEYARGKANYNAGHMEAAKDNFDAAFNLLLRGPMGVQQDERLQAEFDRIVEATHDLELQALKMGDGFTEQRAEPAPIDEANDITFPVDPTIKAKAQAELANTRSDLPLMLTDPVVSYINYFSTRGHGTIVHALTRRGRYYEMISRVFREEGVPQDLVFLAQAESGFQPLALSRAGARGMWQFMPFAGQLYGLQRNWWVDDRQDPEKSTRAAARYLHDLYDQLGDWYLAMAAYNSGAGTVQRAVQRTGYADFWELYKRGVLPGETRNYVPIILAMTIMAKNPTQYGLDHLVYDPPIQAETVKIHYPIDLRLVAECTDSSLAILQELNPSLLRMTTPKDVEFQLHVPAGTAEKFLQAVEAIPEDMRVSWRYHRVESGETLAEIARRYHTTPNAISEANSLDGSELTRDMKLIIPVAATKAAPENSPRASSAESYSKHPVKYTVRKGDTVLSIADSYSVSPEKVRQWNHLTGNALRAGRSLTLYRPASAAETQNIAPAKGGKARKTSAKGSARQSETESEEPAASPSGKHSRKGSKASAHNTRAAEKSPEPPAHATHPRGKQHVSEAAAPAHASEKHTAEHAKPASKSAPKATAKGSTKSPAKPAAKNAESKQAPASGAAHKHKHQG